jgi:hypothetical protein
MEYDPVCQDEYCHKKCAFVTKGRKLCCICEFHEDTARGMGDWCNDCWHRYTKEQTPYDEVCGNCSINCAELIKTESGDMRCCRCLGKARDKRCGKCSSDSFEFSFGDRVNERLDKLEGHAKIFGEELKKIKKGFRRAFDD